VNDKHLGCYIFSLLLSPRAPPLVPPNPSPSVAAQPVRRHSPSSAAATAPPLAAPPHCCCTTDSLHRKPLLHRASPLQSRRRSFSFTVARAPPRVVIHRSSLRRWPSSIACARAAPPQLTPPPYLLTLAFTFHHHSSLAILQRRLGSPSPCRSSLWPRGLLCVVIDRPSPCDFISVRFLRVTLT
jgi:hypothetical protein